MIDTETLCQLLAPLGQEALAVAEAAEPDEADFLPIFQRLAQRFPDPLARAAVEQAILRRRARAKFSHADQMYFAREALEQATSEPLAQYRATRFHGFPYIFDLGCGIGGDTLALANVAPVIGIDKDRIRLMLLAANAQALDLQEKISLVQADLYDLGMWFPPRSCGFFDPARRTNERRLHSVNAYQPPIHIIHEWITSFEALAVKVSPAVDLEQIAEYDCEVEFVSWRGQLKEAILWFGALRGAARKATVLPGPHSLTGEAQPPLLLSSPMTYLYEPDPAVMRAGLVRCLGRQMNAHQIDPTIAFLTSNDFIRTVFARAFRVEEVIPFSLKRLRAALRSRDVGTVTLKKRGSGVDTDDLIRRLRLRGSREETVILTRTDGRMVALIVEPM
ncbi:MAG TPA: SAM-dependent methyltransferase [Anaerolineae bacterium]|nr:SAM-dependent methyltransferase [Anaerolineae bacterium]